MNWLRENTKSIIILTVGAFVATIFFQWGMNYMGGQQQQRSIAEINGEEISFNEFQTRLQQAQQRYREQNPGPLSADDLDELRQQTFRQLINGIILQNHLNDVGISASDQQVRAYIRQRYFRNQQGQINQQRWRQFLNRASPQRKAQLESAQRRQIETSRMQQWLSSQVSLSSLEFQQMLRVGLREANLYGIYLDPAEYVSDQRIQDYYLGNDEEFQASPRARIRTIFFDTNADSPGTNQQQRLRDLKEQLDTIERRYEAGAPFAQLAREFSEDTATRSDGGLIGWVTPDELSDRASSAIFQLEEGTMSNLIKTEDGYNLYYLEEGPVTEKKPLPAVRNQIVTRMLSDTHWQSARKEAEDIHGSVRESSRPFEEFKDMAVLRSHGQTAQDGGHYGWVPARFIVPSLHDNADTNSWQGEIANQFFVNQTVSATVFSDTESALRKPVRTGNGLHLFYVRDKRPARLDQLSDTDTQRIRRVLEQEKQRTFLNQWLDNRREQANIVLNVPEEQVGGSLEEL